MKAVRLDVYLTENGLCKSRTAAQELIKAGGVSVNGAPCTKPSAQVAQGDEIALTAAPARYVGRGGLKLEAALEGEPRHNVRGAVCVDIGASTGGFTDCLLQHGAALVFAVDVGTGQLDEGLRADGRVISLEKTDIRGFSFEGLPQELRGRLPAGFCGADFVCTDVSFISLRLILPHMYRLLRAGGEAVALIKPQFEAGRSALGKKGVISDPKVRERTAAQITQFAQECGFEVILRQDSPIAGGDGNREYLLSLCRR